MLELTTRALLAAALALMMGSVAAQPTFEQEPGADVVRIWYTPTTPARIPVTASYAQPLVAVRIAGYRQMLCTRLEEATQSRDGGTTQGEIWSALGSLDFRALLLKRIGGQSVAALKTILQRAESATTREARFAELFGRTMPPTSVDYGAIDMRYLIRLDKEGSDALVMGQETSVRLTTADTVDPKCLTLTQVDAAIAEAKRIYAAVIAAMEGGGTKGGLTTSAPPSSGLQTQNPKGK